MDKYDADDVTPAMFDKVYNYCLLVCIICTDVLYTNNLKNQGKHAAWIVKIQCY